MLFTARYGQEKAGSENRIVSATLKRKEAYGETEAVYTNMDEYICCFTGHREIALKHVKTLPNYLATVLQSKYNQGFRIFRAGGALGFDTVAALAVLDLKKKHPDVKLDLVLPCPDQAERWKFHEKRIYRGILERADSVIYAENRYTSYCMLKRNRMLVDGSHCCIAYFRPTARTGGTYYTCMYANQKNVPLINVYQ